MSSVSARFWLSLSRGLFGVMGLLPRRQFSLRSSLSGVSASLSTCPSLPPFSLLWRGVLLALGLLYATTCIMGEYYFANAWRAVPSFSAVDQLSGRAARIFPLEFRIRNAPAFLYASSTPSTVSVEAAFEKVKDILRYNPYAADLHANMMKIYGIMNNQQGVQTEFTEVKRLAPNSLLVQQLTRQGFR